MKRTHQLAVASIAAVAGALVATAPAGAAAPVAGNKPSYGPDVSATGRYVVFASDATNLVAGDTNGKRDIFIRDTVAKTTRLVSKGLAGKRANGMSTSPTVSDDGRYVAFASSASNLVAGDTNGVADVFRADLSTGKTVRLSVSATGVQGNGASETPKISGNGQSVAFASKASNLVAGDTNKVSDVFLRDLTAKAVRRISLTPTGGQFRQASVDPSMSNNGAVVGFLLGVWYYPTAVYQWNRGSARTSLVAESYEGNGECGPSVKAFGPRAANGAVSVAIEETGCDAVNWYYEIQARPDTLSFSLYLGVQNGREDYDVSRWGAMAAYSDYGTLAVEDETGRLGQLVTGSGDSVSMSADGSWVGFREGSQVKLWNWRNGSVQTVSVN